MLTDYEQELTTAGGQAVTANSYGTKNYDGKGFADFGVGEKVHALMKVANGASDSDFNNATSIDVAVVGDDDGAGTNEVTLVTKNFVLANLTKAKGVQRVGIIPPGSRKKFLRAKFTVTGTAPTQGKLKVWLGGPDDDAVPANNAFTI